MRLGRHQRVSFVSGTPVHQEKEAEGLFEDEERDNLELYASFLGQRGSDITPTASIGVGFILNPPN